MPNKPIFWIGSAREDLRKIPKPARYKAGVELRALQRGENPADFKPMPTVGKGAYEIRIRIGEIYRIFYVAKHREAVYVLHAFGKKTQKTSAKDIKIGQQRYKEMQRYRQQREKS